MLCMSLLGIKLQRWPSWVIRTEHVFLTFLFLVQTNSWFKTGTVHRCTTDPVLARGPSNVSDVASSQGKKRANQDSFIACVLPKYGTQSSSHGSHGNPVGGGRNPPSMRKSIPFSRQCRVVLPELFSSSVMCAAVITVFGDNLNARHGMFAYIIESFKHSESISGNRITVGH